jgi:AAA+ ATPase superfamily predicted ATPase
VDTRLKDTKNKLVLLGSSISMMTDQVLSYKSPLFGRRTASIELEPMKFYYLKDFFPMTEWEDICRIFAVTDGIPYYIEKVKPPFWKWLENELKLPDSIMRQEVDFLLKYEFTDSRTYRRILEAIAFGNHTPVEIRNYTGMKHSDITPYLKNLMEIKMVRREVPLTEKEHSRKGRYYIADNLVTFWFRFILPNRSAIQEGYFSVESIKGDFNTYMGTVFERIAREMIVHLSMNSERLPFRFDMIGRWWHKEEEIDIVCLDQKKKSAMIFEVKWKDLKKKDVERIIASLERKSHSMGLEGYDIHYGIVAKRSYHKDGLIFDLDDLQIG